MEKSDLEKLLIMLPHWVEHNDHHIEEMFDWLERLGNIDAKATARFKDAIAHMKEISACLGEVEKRLTTIRACQKIT